MQFTSFSSGGFPLRRLEHVLAALIAIVLSLQVADADCFSTPTGLIGWWPGDGNANNVLGTNNGTLQGGATANAVGMVGAAFGFDGTNGYVQIPNSAILQPTNLTIECWVKFNALDSAGNSMLGDQYIVFKQNTRATDFEGFDLSKNRVGGSDYFRFLVASASGQTALLRSATAISTGVWYHVAAVRGANFMQLYVNGVLERQTNVTFAQNYGNLPLYFGTSGQPSWDHKLKGNLDEVSIYNRPLSSNEIAAIYSAGAAGKCKGPTIITQPQSQVVTAGSDVTFTVTATGIGTLNYQWRSNGVPVAGATATNLTISNVQLSASADYTAVVTSSFGSVTSVVAKLTVNPLVCTPAPTGVAGWWLGEGDGINVITTNQAVLFNGATFATGKVGQAFSFDGVDDRVVVASEPLLNFTNNQDFSIEAWIQAFPSPTSFGVMSIAGKRYSPNTSVALGYELYLQDGSLACQITPAGQAISSFVSSSPNLQDGKFHHVALTTSRQNTDGGKLYVDGEVVLTFDATSVAGSLSNAEPFRIGNHPDLSLNCFFKGLIDEVAVYRRALASNEVQSIYAASAAGKCLVPLTLIQSPQSQTNDEGETAVFSALVDGPLPQYQWFFNGMPLVNGGRVAGAMSNSLVVANVSTNDTGDYWLVATNASGAVTSAVARLTVNPLVCTPAPFGIVGWWSGESGINAITTNNAALLNGAIFTTGKIGQAFSLDGVDDRVEVPNETILNVKSNQDFSVEAWIKAFPSSTSFGVMSIVEKRYAPSVPVALGYELHLQDGRLACQIAPAGQAFVNFTSAGPNLQDGSFHHVALAVIRQSGTGGKLYVDGQEVLTFDPTSLTGDLSNAEPLRIGNHATPSLNCFFKGLIDEVSIYGRALALAEIEAIYEAGAAGKCPSPPFFFQPLQSVAQPLGGNMILSANGAGSPLLTYQWYFNNVALTNNVRVSGATNQTLTISNSQPADAGNYFVVLANPYGSATSTVAAVQLGNAPVIVQHPTNQNVVVGGGMQFTGTATGTEPLSYRWYQNATALADDARHFGTTTTNLAVTNLITGDAGSYTLRVTSPFGSATSAVATLTVFTPPSITTQPKGYSVPIGLPVTLAGAASGTAPLRYQWVLNGNPIPNATNNSLTISNLIAANFGNYQLVVTNGGGAVTSAVAPLTVGTVGIWGYYSQAANIPIWPPAGLSNVIAIAAGSSYSMALRGDGTVLPWDNRTDIPPGPNPVFSFPTGGLSGIVSIAAGQSHALALRSNGTVFAWGSNSSGQNNVPATLSNVVAIAAGSAHSAALRSDGTVVVWGGSSVDGQTNIPPGLMKGVAIDAGGSQTLALREDGMLVAWGGRTQYPVPSDLKSVVGFSAGPAFSALNLALVSNGLVRAWGGAGTATNVPQNLNGIIAVEGAGGSDQSTGVSLALRSNRTVTAWGGNIGGVTGLTNVPSGLSNVLVLAGGLSHVVALEDDGRPTIIRPPVGGTFYSGRDLLLNAKATGNAPLSFQWFKDGNPIVGGIDESLVLPFAQSSDAGNYYLVVSNLLGVAQSVTVPVAIVDRAPVLMSQPQSRFAYYGSPFSVGASLTGSGPMDLTWLQNGVPAYFGTNDLVFDRAMPQHGGSYQLVASNPFGAVTSSVAQITFSRVASWGSGPSLTNAPVDLGSVLGVASGYFHALAIRSNGTVAAWGTTANGATNVPGGLTDVVAVAGGSYFSVALKGDGTLVAWGLGTSGQTNVPVGLNNVTAISVGGSHALALRENGMVVAWGLNSSGQTNVPAGLSNVVAIAAGSVHSLALKNDGTIIGWGGFGKIPSYTNVVALAAGFGQSLALQADGTVLAWSTGGGATGLPVGISNVVAISAGGGLQGWFHSVALKADGTVVAWGNNNVGQLNVPGEVTSAITISAGGGSTLAYLNDRSPFVATQPLNRHAVSGTNVTLAALSIGQPTLNFQWRLNGADIPGATNPTLTLTNVSRNSRGNYSALVWNPLGSTNSREAWLDVVGPVRLLPSAVLGGDGLLSFVAADSVGGSLAAEDKAWLEAQASTNLVNWQIIPNTLVFSNGTLLLQDLAQTNYPSRFYRLIEH